MHTAIPRHKRPQGAQRYEQLFILQRKALKKIEPDNEGLPKSPRAALRIARKGLNIDPRDTSLQRCEIQALLALQRYQKVVMCATTLYARSPTVSAAKLLHTVLHDVITKRIFGLSPEVKRAVILLILNRKYGLRKRQSPSASAVPAP